MGAFGSYELDKVKSDLLPKGEYPVVIIKMEEKATKAGNGKLLNVQMQVTRGQFQNKTVFDRFNVVNQNPVAQNIGRQQLKAMLKALGFGDGSDPSIQDVINASMKSPMIAMVDIKDDQQVVKKYKAGLPTSQPSTPTAKQPEQNMVEQAFEGEPAAPTQRPW
jgi:hypothetical protein